MRKNFLICGLGILIAGTAFALSSDQNVPLTFVADNATCQRQTEETVCTYLGQVHFDQGSSHLSAPKVTVLQKNDKINKVIAEGEGSRYITQLDDGNKTVDASAKQITLYPDDNLMVLSGNAQILEDKNKFTGSYLEYFYGKNTLTK